MLVESISAENFNIINFSASKRKTNNVITQKDIDVFNENIDLITSLVNLGCINQTSFLNARKKIAVFHSNEIQKQNNEAIRILNDNLASPVFAVKSAPVATFVTFNLFLKIE